MHGLIEVCVDRLDSVQACAAAGVERIELCAALSEGGLTPSLGFLQIARRTFPGTIMMMLRPRAGDFLYSDAEIASMIHDIRAARQHGADGVVFGCLQASGEIHAEQTAMLRDAAGDMDVTFHRAFDVTTDLPRSLETLIQLGIPRVLTSGGERDVWHGISRLHDLVRQAADRITILPGGGVIATRIAELLRETNAKEIHLSARHQIETRMQFRRDDIPMGASHITPESLHKITDPEQLRLAFASFASLP
jgi:copper homeostasis protein